MAGIAEVGSSCLTASSQEPDSTFWLLPLHQLGAAACALPAMKSANRPIRPVIASPVRDRSSYLRGGRPHSVETESDLGAAQHLAALGLDGARPAAGAGIAAVRPGAKAELAAA